MERKRSNENAAVRAPSGAAVMRAEVTDALAGAFFDEWARSGYAALSLERVARRAGVGKAALYRRWPSKLDMARDLLTKTGLALTDTPPQTSLEGDLLALLLALRRVLRHPRVRRVLTDLHAEIERTPELEAAIHPVQTARRQRAFAIFERAIARGELGPTLDRETAADLAAAPIYWRLAVVRGPSGRAYIERLARVTAAGIRAAQL